MKKTHFLNTVTLTPDSLPSIQKYGWRIARQVDIQPPTRKPIEEPRINQTSMYLRRFKGVHTIKMPKSCFQPNYGQMILLSKRIAHTKKLVLLITRDYLKNYKNFFTSTKLNEFKCLFHYQGIWNPIRRDWDRDKCPDPLHLLRYQPHLRNLSIENCLFKEPDLPHLLDFRRYPRTLQRLELNNLNKANDDKLISSSVSHLTLLKSIRLDLVRNSPESLLSDLLQALLPIIPQLEEFEITGLKLNRFMRYIPHLPFTLPSTIKVKCDIHKSVIREEHSIFLNPSHQFQSSLYLKLKCLIDITHQLVYFPHIQVLDLHVINYYNDNERAIQETLRLFECIQYFDQLKDLTLHLEHSNYSGRYRLKIFDYLKYFFTKGIPIEGFRIITDLVVDQDEIILLYKELEKHALSLKRLQLAYEMNRSETQTLMGKLLDLMEKLISLEKLELPGFLIGDRFVPRLLANLLAMPKLKGLFISDFYLVKEKENILNTKKILEKRTGLQDFRFMLWTLKLAQECGNTELVNLITS